MTPEEKIIEIMKNNQINLALSVPCAKIRNLLILIAKNFQHMPLTREEEGIGIAAGAYLAGLKPLLLMQSGGIGNSLNAIMSLSKVYGFPLPIIISWRGVYKEKIQAQKPMGEHLPQIFDACEIPHLAIEKPEDIEKISQAIDDCFQKHTPYGILLSPRIWESSNLEPQSIEYPNRKIDTVLSYQGTIKPPIMTRFEAIKVLVPYLQDKIVISNIGVPSKELYHLLDQPSNFYMLGSLGLASSIGLGVAMGIPEKEIVVLDGDGSILMNPNTLCTIAQVNPKNLTILAMDNGTHGSTGNQITAAFNGIDLELLAKSFGFNQTAKIHLKDELKSVLDELEPGLRFVHVILKHGNAAVQNIPLSPNSIKQRFMDYLRV